MRLLAFLAAGLLLVGGCGDATEVRDSARQEPASTAVPPIDELDGAEVAAMVERKLEAENPTMAPGRFTCPDLMFVVDESVRCVRIAELPEGRRLRVLGTVTVTSMESNGRLHVDLDDEVDEYGLAGEYLAADVAVRAVQRWKRKPDQVRCPYLTGEIGDQVRCTVLVGSRTMTALVEITGRNDATYSTQYRVLWRRDP